MSQPPEQPPPPPAAPPPSGAPPALLPPPVAGVPKEPLTKTLLVAPPPTGAVGFLARVLRWLSPLAWLGSLLFLPEWILHRVLWGRFAGELRRVNGRNCDLDSEALVVPAPTATITAPDGSTQPSPPIRWNLHDVSGASWMLTREAGGPVEQYVVRLTRMDGSQLLIVDPPKGLTRRLEKRANATPRMFGSAAVWAGLVCWWAVLGWAAWLYLPWADFRDLLRSLGVPL